MDNLDVVVVEYHSGEHFDRLLESLVGEPVGRVVVIDHSSPGTRGAPPQGQFPLVYVAEENSGFGAGVNRAMRETSSDLVLVTNPDVVVSQGTLEELAVALSDETVAIAGPRLLEEDGSVHQSARTFPTLRGSSVQAFAGLLRPNGSLAERYRSANWRQSQGGDVDWVSGACFLVRKRAFEEVGGFDPRYFMYVEEVDLCWRLRAAGWAVRYVPSAEVVHIGSTSASRRPYRMLLSRHLSLWRFSRRTTRGIDRLALPLVACGLGIRLGLSVVRQAVRTWRKGPPSRRSEWAGPVGARSQLPDPSNPPRVVGVVVTYEPEEARLAEVLKAAADQVEHLVVVDNGSTRRAVVEKLAAGLCNVSVLALPVNLGIGAALNRGVAAVLVSSPTWVLTLDQDTVVEPGSVKRLLDDWASLPLAIRSRAAVLGMSRERPPPSWRRRWVERALILSEEGTWRNVRQVITSGNLVRAELFPPFSYNEAFFIDHVDNAFCGDVRRAGLLVLEHVAPTMDHRLGRRVMTRRGPQIYEGGIRLYYISRNGTYLVSRRRMPIRLHLPGLLGLARVYVEANGRGSLGTCLRMILVGMYDGLTGHLGPRDDSLHRRDS